MKFTDQSRAMGPFGFSTPGVGNALRKSNQAQQTKVNRDKTDKVSKQVEKKPSAFAGIGKSDAGIPGPKQLDGERDAWANALGQMSQVRAVNPLTAIAQTAGMGLAGWGQSKATKQKEQGEAAFRSKFAQALQGGDPNAFAQLMGDPYADEGTQRMAMEMWQRQNPTEDQLMQRKVAGLQLQKMEFEIGQMPQSAERDQILFDLQRKKAELDLDQADDPKYGEPVLGKDGRMYRIPVNPTDPVVPVDDFEPHIKGEDADIETFEREDGVYSWNKRTGEVRKLDGIPGKKGENSGGVKDPTKITGMVTGDKQYQAAQVAKSTLNSMYKGLSDRTAVRDMDFVIGLAKILDPTSVVRTQEGEQVVATQAVTSQMAGYLNQFISGRAKLDDKTRLDIYALAEARTRELDGQVAQQRDFYRNMAEENGFNPDTYVPADIAMPKRFSRVEDQNMQMPPGGMPQRPSGGAGSPSPQVPATTPAPTPQTPPQATPAPPGAFGPRAASPSLPAIPGTGPRTSPQPPLMPGMGGDMNMPGLSPMATPPMPPEFEQIIPETLWPTILQEAESPDDLAEFLAAIKQDPSILQRNWPEYFGGQQ